MGDLLLPNMNKFTRTWYNFFKADLLLISLRSFKIPRSTLFGPARKQCPLLIQTVWALDYPFNRKLQSENLIYSNPLSSLCNDLVFFIDFPSKKQRLRKQTFFAILRCNIILSDWILTLATLLDRYSCIERARNISAEANFSAILNYRQVS
jgi:hypothetical protein